MGFTDSEITAWQASAKTNIKAYISTHTVSVFKNYVNSVIAEDDVTADMIYIKTTSGGSSIKLTPTYTVDTFPYPSSFTNKASLDSSIDSKVDNFAGRYRSANGSEYASASDKKKYIRKLIAPLMMYVNMNYISPYMEVPPAEGGDYRDDFIEVTIDKDFRNYFKLLSEGTLQGTGTNSWMRAILPSTNASLRTDTRDESNTITRVDLDLTINAELNDVLSTVDDPASVTDPKAKLTEFELYEHKIKNVFFEEDKAKIDRVSNLVDDAIRETMFVRLMKGTSKVRGVVPPTTPQEYIRNNDYTHINDTLTGLGITELKGVTDVSDS